MYNSIGDEFHEGGISNLIIDIFEAKTSYYLELMDLGITLEIIITMHIE